ncbi:uncharacterized protein LOC143101203 isoform X2 [Alosa pseudoharengus]|uniref:uncharacterized protein LOC143101203 isoform X2 n=1 Tax=Alosa pseudoharengus TaxID=34774 RepID=UPI003F88C3E4
MAAGRSSTGDIPNLSEVRIVLLGNREAGKSSAGNTILGREEFDPDVRTLQCVKRQGDVAGRQVTVVDTPGWTEYSRYFCKDSPHLLKQEIVLSVTVCPPGPHAFLLVIHENMTFTEAERNTTSNHLSFLGHGAWKHSLVLFIHETPAEDKAFEIKGKMLQSLVKNCENRYHVLNIKNKNDMQISELLEKIEEMVAGNSGLHYELNKEIFQKVEEKRTEEERRAEERRKKVQRPGGALLPDLKIVLLGFKDAGKSSSGNTILGREEFQPGQRSAVCVKRQGEVAGRQVTVVEAPGWWGSYGPATSTDMLKREIVLSQCLCDQGPHSFCLVIRVDAAFTEQHTTSVQHHLFLLSETVWSHTMVLFTCGDWLGDTPIEQYIESEEALQSLVEKCGNRYHVLNNQNRGDDMQVTQLLEKIEEIVANKSPLFKMSEDFLQNLEEQVKTEKIRAEKRRMKVKKQRQDLRPSLVQIHQSPLRIVLLAFKEVGKSSTGNTILGEDVFELRSTSKCEKREGEVAGRQVTVVNTPSWWWSGDIANAPEILKQETVLSVSLCDPGPHVILLHIRVDVCFTSQYRQEVQQYLTLFSGDIWSHTMVLFTCGDWLGDTTIEEHIESEEVLQSLIEQCGNRYHVINNKNRAGDQVTQLLEKIEEMVAGNKNCHFKMDRKRLEEVKERRRKEDQRVTERLMKVEKQRQHLQSLKRNSSLRSEFRVVLLGYRTSGKSSSGNTILGREEFDLKRRTAQCVKRQGEVAGRQVTVVEAPGWWRNKNLKDTSELTKQEIVLSVSLCPPGPHILLLIIKVDHSFMQDHIRNIQEHLEFLSERVWSHTMVLFTCGDWLGDTTIEQYIESEEHLRYLVEKCGNRYHVLNNEDIGDRTQITELMEKMEEIIAGNGGRHYKMDIKRLEEVKERREKEEKRAVDRQMCVYRQRSVFQFSGGDTLFISSMRVVLFGHKYAGKSLSGNTILGREEFGTATQCVKRQGEVAGRQVTVVDTPGWGRNETLRDTPQKTKRDIVLSVSLCPPGPHAVLLVIPVACRFTQDTESVRDHLELLGKHVWSHTIVLFTYGDWLGDTSIEQHIESEGETLRWIIGKCGNRYHVLNNKDWTDDTQVTELLEKIEQMVVRNGGAHYERQKEEGKWKSFFKGLLKWNRADDQSRDMDEAAARFDELSLQRSMKTPPYMGGDDRSEVFTVETGYGTYPSPAPSVATFVPYSECGSQESINTVLNFPRSTEGKVKMTGPQPTTHTHTHTSQTQHLKPPQNKTL